MGNTAKQRIRIQRWQVLLPFLLPLFCGVLSGQIRYSIPEEMARGSVVGNIAEDLGLHVRDLLTRNLRVSAEKQYFTVNTENGNILVSDRIDRESLCPHIALCVVPIEIVAENPLNVFHINVIIEDINDNPPHFPQNSIVLQINELAMPGTRFGLEPAVDADVGPHSLQSYQLSSNEHFSLMIKNKTEGKNAPELVLEKPLDREQQISHLLVLTATDGGNPVLTGTTQIQIEVTDANDNAPVFSQDVYRVSLRENVPPGTSVLKVTATDQDEGVNAEITYSFKSLGDVGKMFMLDHRSGEIKSKDPIDFESSSSYTMNIEAKDGGGMSTECCWGGVPASHFVGVDGVRAFLQTYSHEVSLTADSRKSHLIFPQPNYADTLISQESCEKSEPLLLSGDSMFSKDNHALIQCAVLYPVLGPDCSKLFSMVLCSTEPGYLFTKVVAVGNDFRQRLVFLTRPAGQQAGTFYPGAHTGKAYMVHMLGKRDMKRQHLMVGVHDCGQSPLLTTTML
ncbi:Protocadherin gamma-B5 [Tupaia chinensis]|uniref:Protocadherin gamma-B5 n=1 Tax=Tupaia chinensis TaxID=246437 RepID=L8YHU8_TUPCH|nr:Protocadherin gamma-B5 [Tupaia chinensis]